MVETRLSGKESTCQEGNMGSIHGMGRCSGEGNGNPTPVFLPEKCLGQRRLEGYSPWDWRVRHHLVTKQQRVETMLRYTGKHIYGICVFFFTFVNNKKKETIHSKWGTKSQRRRTKLSSISKVVSDSCFLRIESSVFKDHLINQRKVYFTSAYLLMIRD